MGRPRGYTGSVLIAVPMVRFHTRRVSRAMKEDTKIVHKDATQGNRGIINPPVYHASTIAWGSVAEMERRRDNRWEPGVYTYGRHGNQLLWKKLLPLFVGVPFRRCRLRPCGIMPPCSPTWNRGVMFSLSTVFTARAISVTTLSAGSGLKPPITTPL